MILYRLCAGKYLNDPWNGVGAARNPLARWNEIGTPMIYLSTCPSLCNLEVLMHVKSEAVLKTHALISIEIPDRLILELSAEHYPNNWQAAVPVSASKKLGSQWFRSRASVGLMVPSAIVPVDKNVLINPDHPQFASCLDSVHLFRYRVDQRLTA